MRTIIDMPEQDLSELTELSKAQHISRAEIIRRAVAQYIASQAARNVGPDAFGMWKNRDTTSLEYEDRLRQEWETRESRR